MTAEPISVWQAGLEDLAAHLSIRHQVFVEEQGVMVLTDVDQWDSHDQVVHVLGARGSRIGGAVRLYPLDTHGRWRGDRLAVLAAHRASWVGANLVRFAVVTAAQAGGAVMEASVQLPNVRFFEWLRWRRSGDPYLYYGLPHQLMIFDLTKPPVLEVGGRPAHPRLVLHTAPSLSPLLEPV